MSPPQRSQKYTTCYEKQFTPDRTPSSELAALCIIIDDIANSPTINFDEVMDVINAISNNKATGHDDAQLRSYHHVLFNI